jgi:DNA-binding Lrp family transcriptional regulator
MSPEQISDLDEIDRNILRILAKDPRAPYSDIAERIKAEGHEMSGEGIRYRVSDILEKTSIFFLLAPEQHNWEIVRLAISAGDGERDKERLFETLSEKKFWLVCRGVGSYDAYAIASAASTREVDDLITQVRELDVVERVDHSIETDRRTNVNDYLDVEDEGDSSAQES